MKLIFIFSLYFAFQQVNCGVDLTSLSLGWQLSKAAGSAGSSAYQIYNVGNNINEPENPTSFEKALGVAKEVIGAISFPDGASLVEKDNLYDKFEKISEEERQGTTVTADDNHCRSFRIIFKIRNDKQCPDFGGSEEHTNYNLIGEKICGNRICGDGSKLVGAYCGHGRCNVFGRNCDGGCRLGNTVTSFREKYPGVYEVKEVGAVFGSPRYWFSS